MFYKVIKNNRVIDVLDQLIYVKYQPKHNIMVLCSESEAQGIISSDGNTIWHEETLYRVPVDNFETVRIEPISQFEYKQLKILNGRTPEEIIDEFVLSLVESEVL